MELKFLLEKYKKIGSSEKKIKEIIQKIFLNYNIGISLNEIQIRNFDVYIKISGVKKNEYILLKNKILFDIQKNLTEEGLIVKNIY